MSKPNIKVPVGTTTPGKDILSLSPLPALASKANRASRVVYNVTNYNNLVTIDSDYKTSGLIEADNDHPHMNTAADEVLCVDHLLCERGR